MISRYAHPELTRIWSDENKTRLWDLNERAVIKASETLGEFPAGTYDLIVGPLDANPVDIAWWLKRDEEIHHDLNAFIEERIRHLLPGVQMYYHRYMTSFDTEEPAFARMLQDSVNIITGLVAPLENALDELARKHRRTIMMGKSHGQAGDLQSFGKEAKTWNAALYAAARALDASEGNLKYSKMSGAMGNYGLFKPEVEHEALKLLGFEPFEGATQIMPRVLYAPLASALAGITAVASKIALDIRLGARSPRPIFQEPFKKKQKGSSAMPHKRNPIQCEQIEGMARMARGYLLMVMENIQTWEERAIEQSSVERVAWPDLFHVTARALSVLTKVVTGLNVYPDNMLAEVVESRGCYAASQAKEELKRMGQGRWSDAEEAYRIIQLAAFNVFDPSIVAAGIRASTYPTFEQADTLLANPPDLSRPDDAHIREVIARGELRVSSMLMADEATVSRWNATLREIFADPGNMESWTNIFRPSVLLKHEDHLFAHA